MTIDIKGIAEAMEDHRHYAEFYLNTATGKVMRVSRDILDAVEDDDADSVGESSRGEAAIVESVMFNARSPLIVVPELPFSELLELMSGFYQRVSDVELSKKLESMTISTNPTKRFAEILKPYPEEEKSWMNFKDSFYLQEANRWVQTIRLN
ncbi:hypothetical protein F9K33_14030 [bacterium]|nr:MAG: hypothetical protein F9K33_14030 [bacterium]